MPAPFAIPGYYWDEQRQKFFKVEKPGTAPAGAFWSRENAEHVERRRKQEEKQQQEKNGRKRRRRRRHNGDDDDDDDRDDPPRVHRSGLDDCCFFACAAGGPPQRAAASATVCAGGGRFGASAASLAAGVLAGGLTGAGAVAVLEEVEDDEDDDALVFRVALRRPRRLAASTAVSCLYVHGGDEEDHDDAGRLGIVYTNYLSPSNAGDIKGQYVATDANGCIPPAWPTDGRWAAHAALARTRREGLFVPDASAIGYHPGFRRLIVTARRPTIPGCPCVQVVAPRDPLESGTHASAAAVPWALGRARVRDVVQVCGQSAADAVYACAVAPPGASGMLCVVGTHRGLVVLDQERLALEPVRVLPGTAPSAGPSPTPTRHFLRQFRTYAQPLVGSRSGRNTTTNTGQLVTSVDFLDGHPQLVVLGTRRPTPWLLDLREPVTSRGHRFGGDRNDDDDDRSNAVAHVRSVGRYGVVAAGLRNTMLLYDVRMLRGRASGDTAVFRFADYHNEARLVGLGFAADARLGLVAAGEEHAAPTRLGGGVGVFSLATGARLATPGLVGGGGGAGAVLDSLDSLDMGPRMGISHAAETLAQAYGLGERTTTTHAPPPRPLPRIQALSFASLPGGGPSLFAGVGPFVHQYAVGGVGEEEFL